VNPPLLVVPRLRLATALERLVDAAGVTTNVAPDLVPIGVDAGGTANGDSIILLGLPLLLPPFGKLSLSLSAGRSLSLLLRLNPLGLGSTGQRLSGRQHLSRLCLEFAQLTRMGPTNQLAVVDEEQTHSGLSLRRLASSGDALVSPAVLRQQS
jgi:hypothetical protein